MASISGDLLYVRTSIGTYFTGDGQDASNATQTQLSMADGDRTDAGLLNLQIPRSQINEADAAAQHNTSEKALY
jgi:hypothetical protein